MLHHLVASAAFLPAAWPVPAHSVAICEGLEDWGAATDFSNISDSDEDDQPAPLVRVLSPQEGIEMLSTVFFCLMPNSYRAGGGSCCLVALNPGGGQVQGHGGEQHGQR